MKNILFLRHAEALPADADMDDFDRKLSANGTRMVQKQALLVKSLNVNIQHIYTSNAIRTVETSNLFVDYLKSDICITEVPFLYHSFVTQSFLNFVHQLHSLHDSVMFVGHNPEISQLVQRFVNSYTIIFKPATLASVTFESENWEKIAIGSGNLNFLYHAF